MTTFRDHPSYGSAVVTQVTGGSGNMFMSGVQHQHRVRLKISHASMTRENGFSSILPRAEIVSLEFSELQWGQLMSRMGQGQGTPCTIVRVGNELVESCPEDRTFQDFSVETKEQARKAVESLNDLTSILASYREKIAGASSIGKRDLLSFLDNFTREVKSISMNVIHNLPFVATAIQEHAEAIVEDAKRSIAAYADQRSVEIGETQGHLLALVKGESDQ